MSTASFVALDLETATAQRNSICEIGIAIVENGHVVDSKSWLVRPKDNEYDSFNIQIHGITPDMTANAPSFKQVWSEVLPYLCHRTVVAHNTSFDMYVIKDSLEANAMPFPEFDYYCSLRISRNAFPGLYSYSLPLLCQAIDIPFGQHHRAEGDAIGCANIFLKALDSLGVSNPHDLERVLYLNRGRFTTAGHRPQRKKDSSNFTDYRAIIKNLNVDESKIDPDNYFFGKSVCFTGTFALCSRQSLLQAIADIGGIPTDSVTKKTNVLVVGQQDYRVVGDSGISGKQKKAIDLINKGQDLEIMSETEFITNFGDSLSIIARSIKSHPFF